MTSKNQGFRETQEQLSKLNKFVFGNGEIGMDEAIRRINTDIISIKKFMEEYREDRKEAIEKREKSEEKERDERHEQRRWLKRSVAAPAIGAIVMLFINGVLFLTVWAFKLNPP